MWTKCDALPSQFKQDLIKNYLAYGPYETDGTISFEDRALLVNQFYQIQTKLFSKYKITDEMFENVMKDAKLVFRSHSL